MKNALTGEKDNSTTGQAQSGQTAAAAGSSTSVAKVEDAAAYKDGLLRFEEPDLAVH